jgi:hypothetical protein
VTLGYKAQDAPDGYAAWRAFESATAVPETDRNSWSAIVDPGGAGPRENCEHWVTMLDPEGNELDLM